MTALLHQTLEQSAKRSPESLAVSLKNINLTYQQLNTATLTLAHALLGMIPNSRRVYRTIHNGLKSAWKFEPSKNQGNKLNILTSFICGIIQSKPVKLACVAAEISKKIERRKSNHAVKTLVKQ